MRKNNAVSRRGKSPILVNFVIWSWLRNYFEYMEALQNIIQFLFLIDQHIYSNQIFIKYINFFYFRL